MPRRCPPTSWISAMITTLIIVFALSGCQTASIINFLTPRSDFALEKNLSYGNDPRQVLDVYTPRHVKPKESLIVFVHGGSWANGSKDDYLFVGEAFTALGYVTVIPNYRLYPQVKFPAFVEDTALALASLKRVLPKGRCPDQQKIILVGHSAGGHIAAMLATAPEYLRQQNSNVQLQALIGLAAPYDLPLDHPLVIDKFTTVTNNRDANPVNLATSDMPPTLLFHGEQDTTAYPYHTLLFTQRLQELGVEVESHLYPETDHLELIGALSSRLRFLNPVYQDISVYLRKNGLDQQCE